MTQETFNLIINYLATKPYNEVAPIFEAIIKDQQANKDTATNKEEEVKEVPDARTF